MGLAAGAAIGGVAALGGSLLNSNASQNAAQQQAGAANNATGAQLSMFNAAQQNLAPFRQYGQSQMPALSSALGGVGSAINDYSWNLGNYGQAVQGLQPTIQGYGQAVQDFNPLISRYGQLAGQLQNFTTNGIKNPQNLPGFGFQSQWGGMATQNALAAQGLSGSSGPVGKALSDYNQGLAGTYYPQYYNMYLGGLQSGLGAQGNLINAYGQKLGGLQNEAALQQNYVNDYGPLLSGSGNIINARLSAAGAYQNAVNTGANAAANTANAAIQTGQGVGSTLQNAGNAIAAGTLGSANALSGGLTGASNAFSNYALLNSLNGGSGFGGGGNSGSYSGVNPNQTSLNELVAAQGGSSGGLFG